MIVIVIKNNVFATNEPVAAGLPKRIAVQMAALMVLLDN